MTASVQRVVQSSQNVVTETLAAVGTSITLVITLGLMRFAPVRRYREDRSLQFTDETVPPPEIVNRGDRIIRFAIFLYKRSFIRRRIHKDATSQCKFIPSCSEYAIRAVRKYGMIRGLILIGGRFRRCGPHFRGDYVDFP